MTEFYKINRDNILQRYYQLDCQLKEFHKNRKRRFHAIAWSGALYDTILKSGTPARRKAASAIRRLRREIFEWCEQNVRTYKADEELKPLFHLSWKVLLDNGQPSHPGKRAFEYMRSFDDDVQRHYEIIEIFDEWHSYSCEQIDHREQKHIQTMLKGPHLMFDDDGRTHWRAKLAKDMVVIKLCCPV